MYPSFYDLTAKPASTLLSGHEVGLTISIAEAVREAGGRVLVVGGYVRDQVMHRELGKRLETKDVDLEVYGLPVEQLQALLEPIHHVNTVGTSFGVLKVGPLDVSLPRKDNKSAKGHRGFIVEANPWLTHQQAAKRRDFTINSMAIDPLSGELFDEHGGVKDMQRRLLRATDPATFGDDPLRSLRAMQFAGRFEFAIEPETMRLAHGFDLSELSHERIGEEWIKLLTKSERPSLGLEAAAQLGIIRQLHPELLALVATPQEPEWHPEGSVWNHTLLAVDVAAKIIRRETLAHDEALTVMLAALCHDMGKPYTTKRNPKTGRIHSHEHAAIGTRYAHGFMESLRIPHDIEAKVERLVREHMFMGQAEGAKDPAIRRLAKRLYPASIRDLLHIAEADFCGRAVPNLNMQWLEEFKKRAEDLAVIDSPTEPLIKGRDLMALGIKPGKEMGDILQKLEEEQLNGQFGTHGDGIKYYQAHFRRL